MEELTIDQKKAMAMAAARLRLQQPQGAKQPRSYLSHFGEALDQSVRSIASGMTFGLADEAAAGASALTGIGGTQGDYSGNLAAERAKDKAIPASIAIPGQILGGVATGNALGKAGATLLNAAKPTYASMMGRGAAEGAAYGAAYGFGSGEGTEGRLSGAAYGGALGAGTGAAAGAIGAKMAQSAAKATIPTTDEIRTQANAAYKAAEQAGVVIKPQAFSDLADDLVTTAKQEGLHPRLDPQVSIALDDINAARGQSPTLKELENLRRIVGKAAGVSQSADERRIASILIEKIDDFVDGIGPQTLVSGDEAGAKALTKARALWAQQSKASTLENLIERAGIKAGKYTGSGFENAITAEFRSLVLNPKKMRGFTPDERAAIERVAKGGNVQNVMRFLGKFAPRGVVSTGLGTGMGYALGGPAGATAVMAIGEGARQGATALRNQSAQRAIDLVRSGGSFPSPQPLTPAQIEAIRAATIAGAQQFPELGTPRMFSNSR